MRPIIDLLPREGKHPEFIGKKNSSSCFPSGPTFRFISVAFAFSVENFAPLLCHEQFYRIAVAAAVGGQVQFVAPLLHRHEGHRRVRRRRQVQVQDVPVQRFED